MAKPGDNLGVVHGGGVMWRLCALVLVFLGVGCASEGDYHWYDEALKDARGDYQQMRGFNSSTNPSH
jgi:hypothetical protein